MDAPIMLLTGHGGEIYTAKFHPEGNILASAGFDRNVCKCTNFINTNVTKISD